MKKILIALISLAAAAIANVLIEDFERDSWNETRTSLLGDNDVWFSFSDSADVGCATMLDWDALDYEDEVVYIPTEEACSEFYSPWDIRYRWTFEPQTISYENEDGEVVDTTLYYDLRNESIFTDEGIEEVKKEDPADYVYVRELATNNTWVGGFEYRLGKAQLMYGPGDAYNKANPQYWFVPYVAFGVKTAGNGIDYDLSKCTGIQYSYVGDAHKFRADISTVKDDNYHYKVVQNSESYGTLYYAYRGYSTVKVLWSQLSQESWGAKKTFDASKITQLVWELKGGNEESVSKNSAGLFGQVVSGVSTKEKGSGYLFIDDVTCLTSLDSIPVGALSSSSSAPKSSSSKAKSSSSKAKSSSSKKKDDKDALPGNVVYSPALSMQVLADGIWLKSELSTAVDFFDHVGRQVNKTVALPAGSHYVAYGKLAKGMYIARIQYGNESKTVKFQAR